MEQRRIKSPQTWVQSPGWLLVFSSLSLVCIASFFIYSQTQDTQPGSWWGMSYGIAATALMLAAAFLGVRRRRVKNGRIRTQQWVQFHVYGGVLFLLLILLHSGFRWPNDLLTVWLYFIAAWVVLSGLVGVFLQKWIPRSMTGGFQFEALYERIPDLAAELQERAIEAAAPLPMSMRNFCTEYIASIFVQPRFAPAYLFDLGGGIQAQVRKLDYIRKNASLREKRSLSTLEKICRARLELDAHFTLQTVLRKWLYLHIPASLLLIILTALHVFAVIYY